MFLVSFRNFGLIVFGELFCATNGTLCRRTVSKVRYGKEERRKRQGEVMPKVVTVNELHGRCGCQGVW